MYLPDSVSCMGDKVSLRDISGKCVWRVCFAYQSFENHTYLLKRVWGFFAIRLGLLDLRDSVALERLAATSDPHASTHSVKMHLK